MQALIIPFLFLALYVAFIRPQRQRVQAQRSLLSALAPGDRVVTAGGMIGTLRSMDAERATVEVSPGLVLELLAPAIVRRLPEPVVERADDYPPDPALAGRDDDAVLGADPPVPRREEG